MCRQEYTGSIAIVLLFFAGTAAAERHALLIGVSNYPGLGKKYQLEGPKNDVVQMRKLLIDRFSFSPSSIHVLSEESGSGNASFLPTNENITSEFESLVRQTDSGDEVVIFFAGHGSQQPAAEESPYPEPDGLDEIFLPRDVTRWDGKGKVAVPKAIVDDRLAEWFAAIGKKNARLWVIFDCCHSGHMTRAIGETERSVPGDQLGLPVKGGNRSAERRTPPVDIAQEGMAIIYACQSDEKAIERKLPEGDGEQFGLLTYGLNSVLSKASGPLSYRELITRIHEQYIALGRHQGPTPSVEGGDSDRDVLGLETIERSEIVVTYDTKTGKFSLNAGSLHELREGTVLSVHPPPGERDRLIGHVKIVDVGTSSSIVERIAFGDSKKPRIRETNRGRCKVVQIDYGELRLGLAVDRHDGSEQPIPDSEYTKLATQVAELESTPGSLVKRATDKSRADWLLRWNDDEVYLVPGSNSLLPNAQTAQSELGPFRPDDQLTTNLQSSAFRIARARNLLRLAATSTEARVDGANAYSVRMHIEILLFDDREDPTGEVVKPPFTVRPGNRMQYIVRNIGEETFDLTVLEVNSKQGIRSHFPTAGRSNRFGPDDGPRALPRIRITDMTFGREHLVFLAVKAKGVERNFNSLRQTEIAGYRQARASTTGLDALFEKALYGQGKTRAVLDDLHDHHFEVVPLNVVRSSE